MDWTEDEALNAFLNERYETRKEMQEFFAERMPAKESADLANRVCDLQRQRTTKPGGLLRPDSAE